MKIKIKSLGALQQAEFELAMLTIICGGNNTDKTYATYAMFGFLTFWREAFFIPVPK
jgi:predicted ATPase